MALQVRRNISAKVRIVSTLIAVFALVAQPMYGLVEAQVANALGAAPVATTVTQDNHDSTGWYSYTLGASLDFEAVSDAPLGNGALKMSKGNTTGDYAQFYRESMSPMNLSDISLGYSSKRIAGNNDIAPGFGITVDEDGDFATTGDTKYYMYEPTYNSAETNYDKWNNWSIDSSSRVWQLGRPASSPWVLHTIGDLSTANTSAKVKDYWLNLGTGNNNSSVLVDRVVEGDSATYNFEPTSGLVKNVEDNITFPTIQSAVNAATTTPNETLEVSAGTYVENVNVTKSLTIKGAQAGVDARDRTSGGESIVNGTFTVTAPDVTIDGFHFDSNSVAVNFNAAGTKILNNIVTDSNINGSFQTDHLSSVASNVEISQNKFQGNGQNIRFLGNKDDNSKANNVVIKNNTSDGAVSFLTINNTKNSIVTGNVVNAATGSAVAIQGGNENLTIERNTIESSARTIYVTNQYITGGVMYPKNSDIHVHLNNLIGGPTGETFVQGQTFKNDNQHVLDMTMNYWGSANGPYDQNDDVSIPNVNPVQTDTNIGKVKQKINYSSWLCQPFSVSTTITSAAGNGDCDETPIVESITVNATNISSSDRAHPTMSGSSQKVYVNIANPDAMEGGFLMLNKWDGTSANPSNGDKQNYALSQDGDGKWYATVDTKNFDNTSWKDGKYLFKVEAHGKSTPWGYLGNGSGWASHSYYLNVDNTAPSAPKSLAVRAISNNGYIPNNGYTNQKNITASWANSANEPVTFIYKYWKVGHATWNEAHPYKVNTSNTSLPNLEYNLGEGVHKYCVVAVDSAGNESACSSTYTVTYDITPPSSYIVAPAVDGSFVSKVVSVTGKMTDDTQVGSHWFEIKGPNGYQHTTGAGHDNGNDTWTYGWDTAGLEDGAYTIRYVAKDKAGNRSDENGATLRTVVVDNSAPVVKITGVVRNTDGTYTISGTTDDDADVTVYNDSALVPEIGTATPVAGNWSISRVQLGVGEHVLRAVSADAAGNQGENQLAYTVSAVDRTESSDDTTTEQAARTRTAPARIIGGNTLTNSPLALAFPNIGDTTDTSNATADDEGDILGASDKKSGDSKGDVLAATDDKSGCGKFLGLCWYWWIPITVAVVGAIWFYLAARRESDPDPFSGPTRRQ